MILCIQVTLKYVVFSPADQDDFTLSPNTVTLTSTDSKECVVVHFDDDLVLEETESLTVYLSSIQQSVQLSPANVTVFITNDDSKRCEPVVCHVLYHLSLSNRCTDWV